MAGIIKARGDVGPSRGTQPVAFNLDDMGDKANHYLGAVQQEAAKIIAHAREEAKLIRQQAEQKGRDAALRAAEKQLSAQLEQRMQSLLPALEGAIASIKREKQGWLRQWEKNAVRVASSIAERVIRRELRQSPEITLELIREALELAAAGGKIVLCLNPHDYETLGDQAQQLAARLRQLAPADVKPDPEVGSGGCRVDTEFGVIDQRIEAQLARIEEELA
jgi:flagellar assembly protein FliH